MDKTKKFIENELIPDMVKRGDLTLSSVNNQKKIINETAKIDSIEIIEMSTDTTFMLTNCCKVKVKLVGKTSDDVTEYQLVVKLTPPVDEEMYGSIQFDILFENEIIAYTDLIPHLEKSDYPRYVYSYRKRIEACMVLCDFTPLGWRMSNDSYNLSLEHAFVSMEAIGRFHGECYALKENEQKIFQNIIGKLKESRYSKDVVHPVWHEMMKAGPKRAINQVRKNQLKDKIPEEFLKKLEQVLENPQTYGKRAVNSKSQLATICHGDFLRNNIAFQYSHERPDIPTRGMLFDFQTLRYTSPMVDVVVFMFNSIGYKIRTEHFNEIFDSYFNELIKVLSNKLNKTKDKLPTYYSRDLFLKEYARFLPFGLGVAASFVPVLHEPYGMHAFEMLTQDLTIEEQLDIANNRGGELANIELRSMVSEIYHLQKKFNLELDYFF